MTTFAHCLLEVVLLKLFCILVVTRKCRLCSHCGRACTSHSVMVCNLTYTYKSSLKEPIFGLLSVLQLLIRVHSVFGPEHTCS